MRSIETLKRELDALRQDIFSNNTLPVSEKPWLKHQKIYTFLDLCLIANEIEGICIYNQGKEDSHGLGIHLRLLDEDSPAINGKIIEEISIDTHGNLWLNSKLKMLYEIAEYYTRTHDENMLFESCLSMAMADLEYMNGMSKGAPIIQVCGPISTGPGNVEDKLIIFNKYIHTLTKNGHRVFDQMPYEPLFGLYHKHQQENGKSSNDGILEKFYKPLITSRCIQQGSFMHNYNISQGATWEFKLMNELGIKTEILPKDFIKSFWQERVPSMEKAS